MSTEAPPITAVAVRPAAPTKSLVEDSNWISFILMTYLDSLFSVGNKRPLEMEDLGAIPTANRADVLYPVFMGHYNAQKHLPAEKRSMWRAIWLTIGYWRLVLALVLFAISAALQLGPVLILTRLVKYFMGVHSYHRWQLWILVALLFVFPLLSSILLAHSNAIMANIGSQTRNMLIDSIYRKSLTISPAKKLAISTGRILTMFSDDTNQIRNFLFFANNAALAPLQIAACLYLIYEQVGVSMFVGLGYSIFSIPLTGIIFGMVFAIRKQKMTKTDARVKLMNEVLNGIRIIKYYAWEAAFIKKINAVRKEELDLVKKMGYLFNIPFGILLLGAPAIQTTLIFLTYISTGHELDVATAFTTLTLFGIMTSPFIFLPFGIQQYSQSVVSMRRIIEYLDTEDIVEYIEQSEGPLLDGAGHTDVVLKFEHAHIAWATESTETKTDAAPASTAEPTVAAAAEKAAPYTAVPTAPEKGDEENALTASEKAGPNRATHTLVDINLDVRRGELVAIVGTVGSGKSSFLNAVLGEMHLQSGKLTALRDQRIAYCDQRPWIVNATVKDNILFGSPLDEQRLQRAIYAAAMQDDLKILPAGMMTEIGERGINLSGGQKARCTLARAVYNDADIYLLDDPLSAVDAHVGEHIFRVCIKEQLHGKTVLLVTHHLHVLPECDKIVILNDDGSILIAGTYEEIMKSGVDVEKYLKAKAEEDDEEDGEKAADPNAVASPNAAGTGDAAKKSVQEPAKASTRSRGRTNSASDAAKEKGENLITKEERNTGDVSSGVYWKFVKAGGVAAFTLTILAQLCSQGLQVEANFWLTDWGKDTLSYQFAVPARDMPLRASFHWYRGYAGLLMASVFFMTLSRAVLVYHRTEASQRLHDSILNKVMYYPVSFFDVTPIGRIINRFSQDMATIDEDLASTLSQVIGMFGGVLGSVGGIAGSTKGIFLILLVPLGILYSTFNQYFRKANTAIARLESVSRSPIYADFSQTLSGTTTIRAYKQNDRFIHTLEGYANANTVPGVLQQIASQWLSIRLDFLGAIVMFFMGVLAITTENSNFISAGYLALGLSYSIQMTAMLKMAVRVAATLEAQFNSVERVYYYYANNVPTEDEEKALIAKNKERDEGALMIAAEGDIEMGRKAGAAAGESGLITPPADWPAHGVVEFVNAQMSYRDGPLVLKGVSFTVNSHEHVGIAGRTG
jgi:ATP-binding cassette subfamily C (CFTR/MRP) protein 1